MNTYGTELESKLLEAIRSTFPGWEIENPNQRRHQEAYEKWKIDHGNACYFTEMLLPECRGGVFLAFRDGRWGAGIFNEAKALQEAGQPIWQITPNGHVTTLQSMDEIVPLSVPETRQRVYKQDGSTKPY